MTTTGPSLSLSHTECVISTGAKRTGDTPAFRLCLVLLAITPTALAQPKAATPRFNGQAAYALTQQYIAAAPKRFVNSPGHLKAEEFIKSHFASEAAKGNLEADSFTATTPIGQFPMRNYIVRYPGKPPSPGKEDGVIVLASHYETNYPLKDINFVGANDGGATTALLLQLGVYLRTHPPQGYSIWLVFDDGEEAMANPPYQAGQWSSSNSLFGTRHLAARWYADGTLAKIKALIVADMIGDKSLDIDRDGNSTPWLQELLTAAAKNTGHLAALSTENVAIEDDHLPFKQRGVPVLDLIDYDYGPLDPATGDHAYHHTLQDTLDKVSPRSLQTAGDLILELIRLINLK